MSMRPLARQVIATLLLVLLTACHSWRPTTVSPQQLISDERPSSVLVTLMSGEVVAFQSPTMRNDSIVGFTGSSVEAVASRDVRLLEVRRFSVGKTIVVVPLIVVGVAAVAFIVLINSLEN